MTLIELEQCAAQGKSVPKGLSFSESMFFHQMRALYFMVNHQGVSREQAKYEKKQIVELYELCGMHERIYKNSIEVNKEINKLTAPYAELQLKTKDELLLIVDKIMGLITGRVRCENGKQYDM